jgi:hypothetical protein
MLVAVAALVQQTSMIIASQVAASRGLMAQPATMLNESLHFHDNLAINLHVHRSHNVAGHVHGCPYRKPHPASEHKANRVMLVPDDRFSHVAGMRADQALPIEGTA